MLSRRLFAGLGLGLGAVGGFASARTQEPGVRGLESTNADRPIISVLTVDGGGIRGIAAAAMLDEMQRLMKARHGLDLIDCFDVFCGTSTGSIIAAGMARSKDRSAPYWDPARIVDVYRSKASTIFGPKPRAPLYDRSRQKWAHEGLASTLQETFGDTPLSALPGNVIIPYYNMRGEEGASAVVKVGGPLMEMKTGHTDALVRRVVQASCSAPVYFNPFPVSDEHLGVDGGVFANNPSVLAWTNVYRRYPGADILVVSLGCGTKAFNYPTNGTWGAWEWIDPTRKAPLIDVLMRGQSDLAHAQMQVLMDAGRNYFRLQFALPGDEDIGGLDDPREQNLAAMEAFGRSLVRNPREAGYPEKMIDALAARHVRLDREPDRAIPGARNTRRS
jgi:hypothetical protein